MLGAARPARRPMTEDLSLDRLKELYWPPHDEFVVVDVPALSFFMVDGDAPPEHETVQAVADWLFAAVHPIERIARERMGRRFVEPPLESLWWADDVADLVAGNQAKLQWRLMIHGPSWATASMFAEAIAATEERRGPAPPSLRLDRYDEGRSVQILHVGPPEAERPTLERLHHEFLPARGLVAHGAYHEIHLSDPRRTAPEKRKTVLRQPVRLATER